MYRSILALVTEPEGLEPVLQRAGALATRHGAALHVAVEASELVEAARNRAVEGRIEVLAPGDTEALAALGHDVRADLLVVAASAVSRGTGVPAGTPVLATPSTSRWGTLAEGYGHVVVVLDGGQPPEGVLPYATTLAPRADTAYTLLAVVRPGYLIGGDSDVQVDLEGASRARGVAERQVEAVAARLRSRGLDARGRVATRTRQAAAVLELVEEEGVDLIAACCSGLEPRGVGPELVGMGVDVLLYRARERPLRRWAAGAGAREAG